MTKYLFIDTNIYLKFYHFSNDDLDNNDDFLEETKKELEKILESLD